MIASALEIARPYLIALSSVAAVFCLSMLLAGLVQADVSVLYLVAVLFAAWRGGLAAGIVATFLSVAIATYFFLPPVYSFSLKAEGIVELFVFTLAAVLVSSLSAARERALALEKAARIEAERANGVKDEFIAAVSHELRTPLTTIKTLTRLLLKKDPPAPDRTEYLQDIERECGRQIDLVHDLLDLSRIRSGGTGPSLEQIDAAVVVRDCEKAARIAAADNDHSLTVEIEPRLPDIRADRDRLRRALSAVVENAIKYTPRGGHIFLRNRLDSDPRSVAIEVEDNGQGIDAVDLPHIFDQFYRGRPSGNGSSGDAREVSGIGLGLHLARHLVEEMGGTISAKSDIGKGSIITIRIPVWE